MTLPKSWAARERLYSKRGQASTLRATSTNKRSIGTMLCGMPPWSIAAEIAVELLQVEFGNRLEFSDEEIEARAQDLDEDALAQAWVTTTPAFQTVSSNMSR